MLDLETWVLGQWTGLDVWTARWEGPGVVVTSRSVTMLESARGESDGLGRVRARTLKKIHVH